MPGKSKKGGGLTSSPVYKKSGPFKLRSGNSPLFKHMGNSPVKQKTFSVGLGGSTRSQLGSMWRMPVKWG